MARCLIIGCGCHGQSLSRELQARGHVVRGTSRRLERLAEMEASGIDPVQADPDRLATLVAALDHVAVAVLLLGSAVGDPESLTALHGPRLDALLVKLLDTTIRGVVYEAAGAVPEPILGQGRSTVTRLCEASRIPFGFIDVDRSAPDWLERAASAVELVLSPPSAPGLL